MRQTTMGRSIANNFARGFVLISATVLMCVLAMGSASAEIHESSGDHVSGSFSYTDGGTASWNMSPSSYTTG
jgi:hypothetical protein